MNVRVIRFIDKWGSLSFCFFLNIVNIILSLLPSKKAVQPTPKKVLFIKLAELGSIVLAYPLIKKVKDAHPEAQLFFLTFAGNKPLFNILEIIPEENVFSIREHSIFLLIFDGIRAVFRFRKERIDTVFDLEFFSRVTAIFAYLTGAPKRIGFYRYTMQGLYRGELLTHKVQYNPLLHVSKLFLSLWQVAGSKAKLSPDLEKTISDEEVTLPKLPQPRQEIEIRDELNLSGDLERSRIILIHPGEGNLPIREWPLESFIALCRRLLEEGNLIVIVGNEGTSKKARLIYEALNDKRCVNLTGKTRLPQIFALFYISKALVASDCGLAHLAALTPLRQFVIFGPESPAVFGPNSSGSCVVYSGLPCSPCLSVFNHRISSCKDAKCLKMVTPEHVYSLVKKQL